MSRLHFVVERHFEVPPQELWDQLVDWQGHGDWVPATKVEVHADDPHAIGAEFTARTGFGPVALIDRMRVDVFRWHDSTDCGFCQVAKIGPVLGGTASFKIEPQGAGSHARWVEDVQLPYLPRLLAPLAARVAAFGFKLALNRLAAQL